jgi:hypothetical protein
MDDHVVMNILLNYYPKMENWSTTRLLNKSFKKLVDEQKYDDSEGEILFNLICVKYVSCLL